MRNEWTELEARPQIMCALISSHDLISQSPTVHPTPRATLAPSAAGLPMMLYLPWCMIRSSRGSYQLQALYCSLIF